MDIYKMPVFCPRCGATIIAEVKLKELKNYSTWVDVKFEEQRYSHICGVSDG